MARDRGLEDLVEAELQTTAGLSRKAMFGGWAWLRYGNLLCGARVDSLLVRLGKGQDGWALAIDGIVPMVSGGRTMPGWVRASADAYGDEELLRRLIAAAVAFNGTLPPQ